MDSKAWDRFLMLQWSCHCHAHDIRVFSLVGTTTWYNFNFWSSVFCNIPLFYLRKRKLFPSSKNKDMLPITIIIMHLGKDTCISYKNGVLLFYNQNNQCKFKTHTRRINCIKFQLAQTVYQVSCRTRPACSWLLSSKRWTKLIHTHTYT